jgi:hypothetical protein
MIIRFVNQKYPIHGEAGPFDRAFSISGDGTDQQFNALKCVSRRFRGL